jgi:transposase-like protein
MAQAGKTEWSVAERSFPCLAAAKTARVHNLGGYHMGQNNSKKQKRRLTAEEKWRIYRECEQPGAKIGEILRKHGLYASDLQKIRRTVEQGALEELRQSKPGRKKVTTVSIKDHERLQQELAEKEKALAEMTVLFTGLKKKVNLE